MNLLQEIEGLQGEKLASKALSLLLLRSQEIRNIFIDMISDESHKGPLSTRSRFACICEQRTDSEEIGSGYVDILIETDDAIVGVENKFHAPLGENQPDKYLETLREKAALLNALIGNQKKIGYLLVVLLPKDRKKKISKDLEGKGCVLLAWQDVLGAFLAASGMKNLDPMTEVILRALNDFVQEKVGFMSNFTRWYPHFRRSWMPSGDQYQRALLGSLREVFPNPNNKIGAGGTWAGYYFATLLDRRDWGWFGFIPSKSIVGVSIRENEAELIVASTFDVPALSPSSFTSVTVPGILGKGVACKAWVINFDRQWSSPDKWREELNPIWRKVESLQEKSEAEVAGRGMPQ